MADSESALVEEKREGRRFWVLVRRVEGREKLQFVARNPLPPQPQTAPHPAHFCSCLSRLQRDCLKPSGLGAPGLPSSGPVGTVSVLARLLRTEEDSPQNSFDWSMIKGDWGQ